MGELRRASCSFSTLDFLCFVRVQPEFAEDPRRERAEVNEKCNPLVITCPFVIIPFYFYVLVI